MKFIGTYRIPVHLICAVEYGDYSGLSNEEIEILEGWLRTNFPGGFYMDIKEENLGRPYFTGYPDILKAACDVIDVDLYI